MSSEVVFFSDMSYLSKTLSSDLKILHNERVPIHSFADSKISFYVVSKGLLTLKKNTMLDIASGRNTFCENTVLNTCFVRSRKNLANIFKIAMSQAALQTTLQ